MFLKYLLVMFLWLFFLGTVISSPGDEFRSMVHEGELTLNDESYLKYIMPGGYSPHKVQKQYRLQLEDYVDIDDENYQIFNRHFEAGHTMKGLTFNIYDDNMREAAIALFRLFQYAEEDKLKLIKQWAYNNINKDILEYALRMASLFRDDMEYNLEPPFVFKPNYFVNSETIRKALKLKTNHGKFDAREGQVFQINREDNIISINTNYSGWNLWNEECRDNLDYFREDIGLNSYYYGVHLLYPFWMSNDELMGIDPKYTERYYFIHQQLLARYRLEREHLTQRNISTDSKCYDDFIPYLSYDNGLPFSSRSSIRGEWNEEYARIKSIDIAIKECITRGFIYLGNATKVELTENNYVDLLTKLIRANYESTQTAKSIRSLFGYGGNGFPSDRYNPAPSVIHHPQTALRDPIYWYMIQTLLKYFSECSDTVISRPYDLSKYQSGDFEIIDKSFTKITTYYEYYQISLNNIFDDGHYDIKTSPLVYTARQKRLKHLPFTTTFTVESKVNKTCLVKLFLGPECHNTNCWEKYSRFFELDSFTQKLEEGLNIVKWSSETSSNFSFEDYFNVELKTLRHNKFDLFKFPENLIIPKGLSQGLNLTLFVLVTAVNAENDINNLSEPLGFPFHRQPLVNNADYKNYRFFNITIYHKENAREKGAFFSSHIN